MRQSGKCTKCEATQIIQHAMVADNSQGRETDLNVRVDAHPSALLFKLAKRSPLHAYICAVCGFTEFYVAEPQTLYEAFVESQKEGA
jgi:predicted nucleic-acid-binding Zn-ribbon protein